MFQLLLNLIPAPYRILSMVILVPLVIGSIFGFGYYKGNENSKKTIAEYNLKISEANNKLLVAINDLNQLTTVKYIDRIKLVTEKEYVYVDAAKNIVPTTSFMSVAWLRDHDNSASFSDAFGTDYTNAAPSDVKDNQALAVVTENYSICKQNTEQLIALQEWIVNSKLAVESKK